MCKKLFVRASRVSNFRSVTRRPERPPSVIPTSRVLWLVAFAVVWTMTGYGGIAIGQVAGVDDPSDMADSSGDIKHIEAWVEDGNLNLTMTVYGVFAPEVQDTPTGMTNRYYYHWLLDTDTDPATGYNNSEYEGNATNVKTPIGVDLLVQFGWRDGATNGVYAYDPLTEVSLFEDYEYTINGDTIHAVIPLEDLGLDPGQTIALSAYQEGASNDWQVDWIESFELTLTAVARAVLFAEDFEGLELGPNVDEELAGDAVWTDTPPEGWTVDESGIPGIGMDETDGMTEWAGWAFTDKAWWIEAAEDQDRSLFELASGTVAVADPDEWDDGERLPIPIEADPYDTWLTTPEIKIGSAEAGTLELKFDSSWRPEFDTNWHQTANITASFDGGEPVVVMLWESDEASANYKPYATNETVIVALDAPEGAKKVVLTFGLFDAGNDWWWAIDNIEVRGVVLDQGPVNPGTDGLVAFYALDGDATDSSGNGNDGTIVGDPVFVEGPTGFGSALQFDGVDDYVDCGNAEVLDITEELTLMCWIKVAAFSKTWETILSKGDDSYRMSRGPGDGDSIHFGANGTGDNLNANTIITTDTWRHVALVFNGTEKIIYIDGAEDALADASGTINSSGFNFYIGQNSQQANRFLTGLVDEVMIYNRALSEAEVRYLAGERATPVDPGPNGLVAFYALDGDTNDSSGNELHGTIVGDPNFVEGQVGMALELDGVDDYVDSGTPPELVLTEAISIACWVNPAQLGGDQGFAGLDTGYSFKAHGEGVRFTTPGILDHSSANLTLKAGAWQHVAATFLPGQDEGLVFYLNGVETERMASSAINTGSGPFRIGNNQWSELLTGLIDEVTIYDRDLSVGEIRYLAGARAMDDVLGPDVTGLGDVVKGVPDEPRDGSVAGWPDGEYPGLAVDDDVSTKYLHFKGEVEPTGFVVETASGASIVTGLTLTTANDATERDPISFELSGSNESIDGPYELIASGDIVDFAQDEPWPRFTMNATPITFSNNVAYKYYQVMFPAIRDPGSANSMQIAEVELRASKF